ncbi:Dynactin subunit 2 [Apophysomyces ossiformis]|uniref:Dynactin subunit 2 n=1 Tax=Apophysomyces ossiformis TaxID=679940 RepID=A0A8H7BLQ5_9FUNG|nr:Dynactin subunit 2 [Apophysomyces ossiformis]
MIHYAMDGLTLSFYADLGHSHIDKVQTSEGLDLQLVLLFEKMSSKYSGLPDIDDQQDVYETPDVSEGLQNTVFDDQASDDDNENVVRANVSVKDATAKFQDSVVDATGTDFSDRLTRRKKAMYRTYVRRPPALETDEYEILPKELALQETSLQKLRRLMFEVQELNEELSKTDENTTPETRESHISQADLLSRLSYLQSDLSRLNQQFGNMDVHDSNTYGKRIDEAKNLIKQLEAYKTQSSTKTKEQEANDDAVVVDKNDKGDVVTYELYYTPETAKLHKQTKVADIDERIAKIESLVGTAAGQGLEDLPSNIASTSLINTISKLEQQIMVLAQPKLLDTVAKRVTTLNTALDRLNELKSGRKDVSSSLGYSIGGVTATNPLPAGGQPALGTAEGQNQENGGLSNDTEEKVNRLFSTMEKIDPLLSLTPALLTRLKALQGLHTEAATFGRSVKVISEEQSRMSEELKSLTTTCDLLNQSLKENEESINKNINVIDTRMTELVQRVAALQNS